MTPATFHVLFAAASICMQIAVLMLLVKFSGIRAHQLVYTRFNPVCWFALFFGVWFLSPQVVSLLPSHLLIGFEDYSSAETLGVYPRRSRVPLPFPALRWLGSGTDGPSVTHCHASLRSPSAWRSAV